MNHANIENKSNGHANGMVEKLQQENNKTAGIHESEVVRNVTQESSNGKVEESPEDDKNSRVISSTVSAGNISDGEDDVQKPAKKGSKKKKPNPLQDLLDDADWFTNDFGSRRGLRGRHPGVSLESKREQARLKMEAMKKAKEEARQKAKEQLTEEQLAKIAEAKRKKELEKQQKALQREQEKLKRKLRKEELKKEREAEMAEMLANETAEERAEREKLEEEYEALKRYYAGERT
ncbi:unnamed protein product [Ambrosiozyma monospora]|uniref:Unnamed protein product n=1 Tax=Ambrosiozyma monospora TaxID=43982 RepID=A0A9W6WJQ4_AMBMO|nr:unnamed protein product [Ambrosiozyma monospora]